MLACFSCRSEALAVPLPLLYGVIRTFPTHLLRVPPKTPARGGFQNKMSVRITTEADVYRNGEKSFSSCDTVPVRKQMRLKPEAC